MSDFNRIRKATHAGSWYCSDSKELEKELSKLLAKTKKVCSPAKALISPHAGYAYCGGTAAWSWAQLDAEMINRVVLLGPSHHFYLSGCALPDKKLDEYATPFGNIQLDKEELSKLRETNSFQFINQTFDQQEHSLEMQLPFLKYIMKNYSFKIIPILVGELNHKSCISFAKLLLPYFEQTKTVFVISSDFCHWGLRFHYNYIYPSNDSSKKNLYESIQALDEEGISFIEDHNLDGFWKYLDETGNTICGQNPIKIFLQIIAIANNSRLKTKFLHYSQSSKITVGNQSSVSYASIVTSLS